MNSLLRNISSEPVSERAVVSSDTRGRFALWMACVGLTKKDPAFERIAIKLLENGANPNSTPPEAQGQSALWITCVCLQENDPVFERIAIKLLENGADPNAAPKGDMIGSCV